MTKTQTPAKLLLRYLWPRMQRGERHFVIDDTQLTFSQNVSNVSPRGTHLNIRTASGSTRGSATDSVVMLPASARGTRRTRNDKGIRETQQRNV